jgi:Skp family chaperone for outer membrane proteins
MTPTDIILAILGTGAASSALGAGITGFVGHRLRNAQAEQITSLAHSEIFKGYGGLIVALEQQIHSLRDDVGALRIALSAAEALARASEERADIAEDEVRSLRREVEQLRERLATHERNEAQLLSEIQRLNQR